MKLKDLAAVAVLALIPFGCGQVKTADDKVLAVQGDSAAAPQSQRGQKVEKSLSDLAAFWKLFAKRDGSVNEGELGNIYGKVRERLVKFLKGEQLSASDLFELFLALN